MEFLKTSELSQLNNIKNDSSFKMLVGTKSFTLVKGKANFSSLKIYAKPNSEVFFKVTTTSISRYFAEFFQHNQDLTDSNIENQYAYIFSLYFRDCIKGEIFLEEINRYYK